MGGFAGDCKYRKRIIETPFSGVTSLAWEGDIPSVTNVRETPVKRLNDVHWETKLPHAQPFQPPQSQPDVAQFHPML
jgi:hypothetical protein